MKIKRDEVPEHFQTAGIDSDLIVYRAAFAAQHTFWDLYHGDEFVDRFQSAEDADRYVEETCEFLGGVPSDYTRKSEVVLSDAEHAREACDTIIEAIMKEVSADTYKFYLTDSKGNYRERIAKTLPYKGNRPEKPHFYQVVKDHIRSKWRAIVAKGAEADDAVSVIAYRGYMSSKYDTCIVTADKDLKGTPGYLYNFTKNEWHYTDELEADRFFFMQCLMGDKQVDNIQGLANVSEEFRLKYGLRKARGIGKKTAEKLLQDCETAHEMFDIVREAYESYHGDQWEDILNEMGALLWMQRKKGEIFCCDWYNKEGSK